MGMRKIYVISEQQARSIAGNNILKKIFEQFKNSESWKFLSKNFDKDLVKFIYNITSSIPSLKGKEKEILKGVLKVDSNPMLYLSQIIKSKTLKEQYEGLSGSRFLDGLYYSTVGFGLIWLAYMVLAFFKGWPIDPQISDIKDAIRKRIDNKKMAELEAWLNSPEGKKEQEEKLDQEFRQESRRKAEIAKERVGIFSSSPSLSKQYEIEMWLQYRNSHIKGSQEWNDMNEKYERSKIEYQEIERLENIKKEEDRQKKLEELRKEEQRLKAELERLEKLNAPLKKFEGKSVNFYNDRSQQVLYGKDVIKKMIFDDTSKIGSRSGIYIYTDEGLEYEIICLSNPDRLADYLVLHKSIKDLKYNSSFVNAVKQVAPNFCKKPKADFSAVRKPNTKPIA
jgi:hypothetical protein